MGKEITVQELIDQLNKIENKNLPIDCTVWVIGPFNIKEGGVVAIESIAFRTTVPSETPYAATIVLGGTPQSIVDIPDGYRPIGINDLPKELFEKLSRKVADKNIVVDIINDMRRHALLAVADETEEDSELENDNE